MVNKKKDVFDDDFNEDPKVFKDANALENDESSDKTGPVNVNTTTLVEQCKACNGTGAVPENILKGVVDKWKDCPMCGASGTAPKVVDENVDPYRCAECNGSGKVVDSYVDGKPDTYKNCPTCDGKGVKLPNV